VSVPIGLSDGSGHFAPQFWSVPVSTFTTWATDSNARVAVTDLDGDGRADIVLAGGSSWSTVPVAIATSNNAFTVYNQTNQSFPVLAKAPGAKLLGGCRRTVAIAGHPNWHHCNFSGGLGGDVQGDIALTGALGSSTIPVGFYHGPTGNGVFSPVTNDTYATFATWAQDSDAKAVSGDFDGDGRADIALVGGNQWWTVPVAFSKGDGTFNITNLPSD
jgi:hypothetical protein